jgi:histidine ammonia-lyase
MESLAACQGIELLRPLRSTQKLESIISQIRKISAPLTQDRSLSADIMKLAHKIKNQEISL